MHEACSQRSTQEIQEIYFVYLFAFYKNSTCIYIEHDQGHIHHDLHTVVGGVQAQGHQETTEAIEDQGHQKEQGHLQEEGLFPHVKGQDHQDKLSGGHPQEGLLQEGQGHHLMRGTSQ